MRPIRYISILLMTSLLTCTKKVTIKVDPLHKRLVVHGYVATNDTFAVTIGRTARGYIDLEDYYVKNAEVLLYSNGILLDTLQYDNTKKQYVSDHVVAEVRRPYTLKVSAPDYPPVEATDMAPLLPVTESLEHHVKTRKTTYGWDLDDIVFSFRDPAEVKNYYLTELHSRYEGGYFSCVYSTDAAIERATTSLLPFDEGDCVNNGDYIFFTDKSFDGQLKTLRISASTDEMDSVLDVTFRWKRPYLRRLAVSEAFYTYHKYTETLKNRADVPFFSESTDARGNVKEGYGIFTIYDYRVDTIR